MRPIIRVERLSKAYEIGLRGGRSTTLREALARAFSRSGSRDRGSGSTFQALREVSFDAQPGDVIGIVGKNGAGKSTLLKILSRITDPTAGRVELYGRVGSLLEVGTGFHQDLTGRENVYLNGAILGMRRAEIAAKFDEIVAFAGVERFIDTPVKHYSSGMYLRLAFAVAAFLESEVLLVDEVLAVGDAAFQKRCLGKMREVSASGRTVLFVSHNMAAVEALCNRCLYISDGSLQGDGVPHEIIGRYLAVDALPRAEAGLVSHPGRRPGSTNVMRMVVLSGESGVPGASIRMGTGLDISVTYECDRPICPVLGLVVKNGFGVPIFGINNRLVPGFQFDVPSRTGVVTCRLERLPLMPATYSLDLFFGDAYQDYDVIYDAVNFEMIAADVLGNGKLPGDECGSIVWPATWRYEPAAASVGADHA